MSGARDLPYSYYCATIQYRTQAAQKEKARDNARDNGTTMPAGCQPLVSGGLLDATANTSVFCKSRHLRKAGAGRNIHETKHSLPEGTARRTLFCLNDRCRHTCHPAFGARNPGYAGTFYQQVLNQGFPRRQHEKKAPRSFPTAATKVIVTLSINVAKKLCCRCML